MVIYKNKKGFKTLFKYNKIALICGLLFTYNNANAFLYDLKIMGIDKNPRGVIDFDIDIKNNNKISAKCSDLKNLKVPALPECDGKEKVDLSLIGTATVNDLENVIELKIPTDKMPLSIIDMGRSNYAVDYSKTTFSSGLYANYDLSFSTEIKGNEGSLWDLGTNIFGWEAKTMVKQQANTPLQRINSTLSKEFDNGKIVNIGDIYSDVGGVLGPRMLQGIQLRSDKDVDAEGYLLSPTVKLNGMAEASSTVEVLINGASILKNQINEGPYSIRNISPAVSGTDVEIVVTDVLGRTQVIKQSLYGDTQMLAEGKNKYVVTTGKVRLQQDQYGPISTSGYYAYGIKDNFNIRGAIDSFNNTQKYGTQLDYVNDWGRVKGTYQGSTTGSNSKSLFYSKGFKTQYGTISFSGSTSYNKSVTDTGTSNSSVKSTSVSYGYKDVNLSWFFAKQDRGYFTTLSGQTKLGFLGDYAKLWTLGMNYGKGKTPDGVSYSSSSFAVTIPLDTKVGKGFGTAKVENKDGKRTDGESFSFNMPSGLNVGASLNNGNNLALYTSKPFEKFDFRAQTTMTNEKNTGEVSFSGGIIGTGDGIAMAKKVTGSWAVVDTIEPEVPVLINKTIVGKSNSNGVLIASMPAKRNIDIEIDERYAPLDIEAKSYNVAAPPGKGAKVQFAQIVGQFIKPPEGFKGQAVNIENERYPITEKGIWVELPVGKHTVYGDFEQNFEIEILPKQKK